MISESNVALSSVSTDGKRQPRKAPSWNRLPTLRSPSSDEQSAKADQARRRTGGLTTRLNVTSSNATASGSKTDRAETAIKLKLPSIEPWPESVDGSELLDEITTTLRRYLVLPEYAAEAMALWVLFAHAFDAADTSPRLALLSPVPECGKTTALSLLSLLVPRPLLASNFTPAIIFRAIDSYSPVLLMDEADTYVEGREDFRGILNSGHTRSGASVLRCVGQDNEPKQFSTWAPVAIAKIGQLPPTLEGRSIVIPMRRKRTNDAVVLFRLQTDGARVKELARKAARWANDTVGKIGSARVVMPAALTNRVADNWRPLLAIAATVGGRWPAIAGDAAIALSSKSVAAPGEELLADIRNIYEERRVDRMTSKDLCSALAAVEGRPWATYEYGLPTSPTRLAVMLRPFDVKPSSIRVSPTQTPKGYLLSDFDDAFARYLPASRNTATNE